MTDLTLPSRTLFIDPGSAGRGNAVALYDGKRLGRVWFERLAAARPGQPNEPAGICERMPIGMVVVELPEYQGDRSQFSSPASLMKYTWSGGLLAGAYAAVHGCHLIEWPSSAWKGRECKPHQHKRMWGVLTAAERKALGGAPTAAAIEHACKKWAQRRGKIDGAKCYSSEVHNLLDAAAMGCVFHGRI